MFFTYSIKTKSLTYRMLHTHGPSSQFISNQRESKRWPCCTDFCHLTLISKLFIKMNLFISWAWNSVLSWFLVHPTVVWAWQIRRNLMLISMEDGDSIIRMIQRLPRFLYGQIQIQKFPGSDSMKPGCLFYLFCFPKKAFSHTYWLKVFREADHGCSSFLWSIINILWPGSVCSLMTCPQSH